MCGEAIQSKDMLLRAVCLLLGVTALVRAGIADLREPFRVPPAEAKIMMRWWWFGPAVTHSGLEREMRTMKAGGIGGFEVQPVYPLALDDPAKGIRNLPYLQTEFLDAVRFTAQRAGEPGLRVDMTMGSGWPYGGPYITPDLASARFRVENGRVTFGDHGYRVIVLPGVVRMPDETKIRLKEFVSGGVLVATRHVPDGVEAIPAEEDATLSKLLHSRLMADIMLAPAAPVREAAVIYVRGLLRSGANDLRIEVANTAMNEMAGAPPLDYSALIPRYGRRFDMQDLNLVEALPSGLLGPIQLVIR